MRGEGKEGRRGSRTRKRRRRRRGGRSSLSIEGTPRIGNKLPNPYTPVHAHT